MSTEAVSTRPRSSRFMLPLALFGVLVALLAVGLTLNPREVPSPLIGKPAPDFRLPQLHEPEAAFSPTQMLGKIWILNVWASWSRATAISCVTARRSR